MFFKRNSRILFRDYVSFGYIIDGSSFLYKTENNGSSFLGSRILSESASLFFSVLERIPRNIDQISSRILEKCQDIQLITIKEDAEEFYKLLEQDGFVLSGSTAQECEEKDEKFSYKLSPKGLLNQDPRPAKEETKTTFAFLEEEFRGAPQLTNIHIEITSKCSERCVHCYIPHNDKLKIIDSILFYKILDQCINMRVLHLSVSGGEPMLHPDFCKFLKRCREYDFSVSVLSNLTLLDDDIIKEMKCNPLLGVQTSLYSMDPDTHDKITNMKGSFNKTMKSINKLLENDIPLQISCPIIKQNENCYIDVIMWANEHNIRVSSDFVIIAEYSHTSKNLECRLSLKEIENIVATESDRNNAYFDSMLEEADKRRTMSRDDGVCSVCSSSICITETGNVYPCAGWRGYVVGNVKETSLSEIWSKSEKIRYLRELNWHSFPKCTQCPDKEFCTMCMVRNANEHPLGDPLVVSEYFCGIARINKEVFLKKNI